MKAKFEVGGNYWANDNGFGSIKVLKRTAKSIRVLNDCGNEWMMRIKTDKDGNEYVTDSCVPKRWQYMLTYEAISKVE